jgi:hypothetical protein
MNSFIAEEIVNVAPRLGLCYGLQRRTAEYFTIQLKCKNGLFIISDSEQALTVPAVEQK